MPIAPGIPSHAAYTWTAHAGGFGNQTAVDKVPPDMLHLVDAHWYQFPPMNPLWHAILGFVIGLLGTVAVIGNGMVIYIFTSTKSLRTPSNLLVINLAISDFLMMLSMSPPMVRIHLPPTSEKPFSGCFLILATRQRDLRSRD